IPGCGGHEIAVIELLHPLPELAVLEGGDVENLPQRAGRPKVDVGAEHLPDALEFVREDRRKRLDDESAVGDSVLVGRHISGPSSCTAISTWDTVCKTTVASQ